MSTARDPGYHDPGYHTQFGHDVDQPTTGTHRPPGAAGFRGAAEERLLAPTVMAQAQTRRYGPVLPAEVDRQYVLDREQGRFGGIRSGAALLGWMAAFGITVLFTALLGAAGVALGLTSSTTTTGINNQATAATGTVKTIGLIGAILLLVLFVAYYCGGYVAGRMARFNGAKQGLAVWLWGIGFAAAGVILVKVAGSRYNIASSLSLPHIPISEGDLATARIIAITAAAVVTLGAALLGGRAGMRFHRQVDRVGHG